MIVFYAFRVEADRLWLSAEEAGHCRVLRKNVGDVLRVTDGRGHWYDARLEAIDLREARLRILNANKGQPTTSAIHVALAIPKQMQRFEWFLEKATELGITDISPIICQRSERKHLKMERAHRILIAAMKQSLRCDLPTLHPVSTFENWIETCRDTNRYIAKADPNTPHLWALRDGKASSAVVVVGPEGDFTDDEINRAADHGFVQVGLGPTRLRTETAALAACHILHLGHAP